MKYKYSSRITLWVVRFFMLVLVALLFGAPGLVKTYVAFRGMAAFRGHVLLAAFYVCAPAAGLALYAMDRLLLRFLREEVFAPGNARLTRLVSLCCAWVGIVTLVAGCWYPPLLFVAVLMSVLFLAVLVVTHMLEAATAIREENDLTI